MLQSIFCPPHRGGASACTDGPRITFNYIAVIKNMPETQVKSTVRLLCASALLALFSQAHAAYTFPIYGLQQLSTPGADYFNVTGINNVGQLSGDVRTADGTWHAVRWDGGVATYLGTPTGLESSTYGINDQGLVVGTIGSSPSWKAVIWNGNSPTFLPSPGVNHAVATAINEQGTVVGYVDTPRYLAAQWAIGGPVTLPVSEPYTPGTSGNAINNSGQIVGSRTYGGNSDIYPVLWSNGVQIDLQTSGSYAHALDINDSGEIVGYGVASFGAPTRVMFWDANGVLTMGPDNSFARSINNRGQVVGVMNGRPTLWDDGAAIDLSNSLAPDLATQGWTLDYVAYINDNGLIYGGASLNGVSYGVLLSAVPEPATWQLLLASLGLGVLLVKTQRSRARSA